MERVTETFTHGESGDVGDQVRVLNVQRLRSTSGWLVKFQTPQVRAENASPDIGEVVILGNKLKSRTIVIRGAEDNVSVTVGDGSPTEVYSGGLRDLGFVPELTPPADGPDDGMAGSTAVPRQLDRDLTVEEARNVADVLQTFPPKYAATFPDSTAKTVFVRGTFDNESANQDWAVDFDFAAVRGAESGRGYDRRRYNEEDVIRRMVREPSTRLVRWDDAPRLLYWGRYRDRFDDE